MKSSDVYAADFDFCSEKPGELAFVKMLMMDTENMAQKMNLQRKAQTGILVVDNTALHQAKLMGSRKDWRRNGSGVMCLPAG
jgi:hypothetical protein